MIRSIDAGSPLPPFEQLRRQIVESVRSGDLVPGAKLPTVRGLADELGLAPNTVAKAYRELERGEVIVTRGRRGSYIAATGDPTRRQAQTAATEYAALIRQLDLTIEDGLQIVTAALRSGA